MGTKDGRGLGCKFSMDALELVLINKLQNRVTVHSATLDWGSGERRHLARITPQAEIPFETPYVKPEPEIKA